MVDYETQINEMVKDNVHISTRESDFYRQKVIDLLGDTYDTSFLRQLYMVITAHNERQ